MLRFRPLALALAMILLFLTAGAQLVPDGLLAGISIAPPALADHDFAHGGSIYSYVDEPGARTMRATASDGDPDLVIMGAPVDWDAPVPGAGSVGRPSNKLHFGERWYLNRSFTDDTEYFPSSPRYETNVDGVVVRGGVAEGTPLIDDNGANCVQLYSSVKWAPDATGTTDGALTFLGRQWSRSDPSADLCDIPGDRGVFRADVTIGSDGTISASALVLDTVLTYGHQVSAYDWAPNGQSFVFVIGPDGNPLDNRGLWVADSGSPPSTHTQIFASDVNAAANSVDWSPDGTSIVFTGSNRHKSPKKIKRGTWTIDPDGSNATNLVEVVSGQHHYDAYWSPSGAYITYLVHENWPGSSATMYMHVMEASGANDTVIRTDPPGSNLRVGLGWVEGDPVAATGNPPTADAAGPYTGTEDVAIAFDGTASSDPDGDSLSYSWDFGDGSTGTGATPSHTYLWGGTFNVSLTVDDGNGNSDTATTTATVTEVNDVPVADAGGPYSGDTGAAVAFDGSGSTDYDNLDGTTANDQVLSYSWTFGDGGTGSGASPSHTYAAAGSYSVGLTVSDGVASDGATTSATITDPPAGPTVTSVSPSSMSAGSTIGATIYGSGFLAGATVSFGNGSGPAPSASGITVAGDGNSLTLTIQASGGGPKGTRTWDVTVTNLGGASDTLVGGFDVVK